MLENILVPLSFFASVVIIVWKYFDTRHKERLLIVEADMVNENLKYLFGKTENKGRFTALKYGLLIFFSGLGMMISTLITKDMSNSIQGPVIIAAMCLGGGLGLVIDYFIVSHQLKKEERENE